MMKRALSLALAASLLSCLTAQADPVSDFFRRLGDTIVNGPKRQKARREEKSKPHRSRDQETPAHETALDISPSPAPSPVASPTPEPVRRALAAPATRRAPQDLRYGVPVPQQPGLVRSPWSPSEGFVDVSEFPSGTEVTDPFSGKTFLTP